MSDPVRRLILEFLKLPGVGEKNATRLAYHILKTGEADVRALADALTDARDRVRFCRECFTFSEADLCSTCSDDRRARDMVCVVEKPADALAIESSQSFHGRYHILHGVLSPIDGIGAAQIRVKELLARVSVQGVSEVILAINPNTEGDATRAYLTRDLRRLGIRVTRIAVGIPKGGMLEYIDRQTIGQAIENRVVSA